LPILPSHPLIKTASAKKADKATTNTKLQICRNFMLHLPLNLNNCELVLISCRCFTAYRHSTAKRPAYFKSDILSIWSLQFRKWSAETLCYLPILPWAPWHPLIKTTSDKRADTATNKTKLQICRNFMLHLHVNLNNRELVVISYYSGFPIYPNNQHC
jgi:hypothetical protein